MEEKQRSEVQELIREELRRNGINPDEPEKTADLLRWSARHMRSFESAGSIVSRSVVLALVTGLALAIWEGFKHLISRVHGG